jgi:hypothetical protein
MKLTHSLKAHCFNPEPITSFKVCFQSKKPVSKFAFKFNLYVYIQGIAFGNQLGPGIRVASLPEVGPGGTWWGAVQVDSSLPIARKRPVPTLGPIKRSPGFRIQLVP